MDADAIVVGAGLAGLVAVGELLDAGRRVILVDHAPFRRMDPVRLQTKVVIDTRGVLARG